MNNEKKDFKFDVFISYRHSDLDSAAAAYLHKALENYKIPKEIQEKIGKKRINRVFRDEEELGASSDLFTEIENSIKESEYLLVVLSPRYKQSKWCLKEIESFLKYRSRDNVLAVIIEGEPYDVFPEILLEDGEPLALDIRAQDKKQMLKYAKERLPRLVAPILGCSYDELYQRHRVWRMRRVAMLSGVVAALSLAVGAVTIKQNIEINKNFVAKQENQSRYLAKTATDLLAQGDRETALLVALEALPKGSDDNSRPYVAQARIALENALYTYNLDYYYNLHPIKIMEMASDCGTISDYNQREDVLLTSDDMGTIYIWDAKTAQQIFVMDRYETEDARLLDNNRLLGKTADGIYCVDYTTGEMLWAWLYPQCEACYTTRFMWDYSPATDSVVCVAGTMSKDKTVKFDLEKGETVVDVVLTDSHRVHTINCADGTANIWTPQEYYNNLTQTGYDQYRVKNISISPDGSMVALQVYQPDYENNSQPNLMHLYVYPTQGGDVVYSTSFTSYQGLEGLYWTDSSHLLCAYTDDTSILSLGILENPHRWYIDCYDVVNKEKLYGIEEQSMSLSYKLEFNSFESKNSAGEVRQVVSVINGNTVLIFDQHTGHIYSRIEDRSQIRLAQPLPNQMTMLVVTLDGYVFVTKPLSDEIYNPVLNSLMYYLDVGFVEKCERYNDKTYIFNGSSVYWYQDYIDFNFEKFESSPATVGFSESGQYMYSVSHKDAITLYDVNTKQIVFTDGVDSVMDYNHNADIVDNRYMVYPSNENGILSVYDITSGTVKDYPMADPLSDTPVTIGATNQNSNFVSVWYNSLQMYTGSSALWFDEKKIDNNVVWVKNITDGTETAAITPRQTFDAVNNPQLYSFMIESAMLSGDDKYLIISGEATLKAEDGTQTKQMQMLVWDIKGEIWLNTETDAFLNLVDSSSSVYTQDGWIMPGTSLINTYHADGRVDIVDLAELNVVHSFTPGVVGSREISFTPDGNHLIFQDGSNRLKIYNWKEGRYTLEHAVGEQGALEFEFYRDGQQLSATLSVGAYISKVMQIYDLTADGVYTLQNSISGCVACDGNTTVISENDYSRFYPYYTFDQLIEMAQEILDGRTLTAAERQTYFID